MAHMTSESTDIVIIGGGPAGGTLACALAQGGINVTLIDKGARQEKSEITSDGRAWAITSGSSKFLTSLDIWEKAKKYAAPIREIRVSDQGSNAFVHYDHKEVGTEALGYIIQSPYMNHAIQQVADTLPNLTWVDQKEVTDLTFSDTLVQSTIENNEREFSSPLVIVADGRHSPWRKKLNQKSTQWSYKQTALVCTVEHEEPHLDTAFEHFRAGGPFALLPTPHPNRSSIVWSEKEQNVAAIQSLNDEDFSKAAQEQFGDYLGKWKLVGKRWSYPLGGVFTHKLIGERTAFIGDAAHGIHPVAGQGLNLGFQGIQTLSKVLLEAQSLGLDLGSSFVLQKYQRKQRFSAATMTAGCDSIVRLFSTNFPPARWGRRLSLKMTQKIPFVRKALTRYAMGGKFF
ncbi:MAG: UbiH/UbiF/VisC/COQ6 family ubiquinone biosynthesis hydroxylase [bacterium]|nr:UbiH/UbiF/VisC/COQ6 family ubiquinone biosynthesis hydroxylase [bacterium]